MNDETNATDADKPPGVQVNAGDSLYIPAGGLQLRVEEDGTFGIMGVTVAVDPWLPNIDAARDTSLEMVESILDNGLPISTICNRKYVNVCQKHQEVRELIGNREVQRLGHMVVLDGQRAVGILNLDKARGKFRHGDSEVSLLVEELYEPANESNVFHEKAPLMDYLLTADQQPFRLIAVDGGKLATVDVEDLQKMPVRVVLLMWFSYLEALLVRRLCQKAPELNEIARTSNAVEAEDLGKLGPGPERRIERYKFAQLLKEANKMTIISLLDDEINYLSQYRNSIFHGPRWYITRRGEVSSLVNCVKKVVSLARELASR